VVLDSLRVRLQESVSPVSLVSLVSLVGLEVVIQESVNGEFS